jgi:hypothetical protein
MQPFPIRVKARYTTLQHVITPVPGAIKMFYYFIEYHRAKLNTLASILSPCVAGCAFIPHFCDGK